MAKNVANKILKWLSWTLGAIILIVLLLPVTLYIPWVQNKVKDYACEWASEKTGMDISVGKILIKFALDVSVDDVLVINEKKDTMIMAKNLTASVSPLPLLHKKLDVERISLTEGFYNMTTEDESMILRANVEHCDVNGVEVNVEQNEINLLDGLLCGGKVDLTYLPYKKEIKPDTTETTPWHINAYHLALEDIDYTMQMLPTIDRMTAHVGKAELTKGVIDLGERTVDAEYLAVDSADVDYTYPDPAFAARYDKEHPVPIDTINPPDTIPWAIRADSLRLTNAHARYALAGTQPKTSGLDTDYIEVNDLNVAIDNFYNKGTEIAVPIKSLSVKERCGLKVNDASGILAMDDNKVEVNNFKLKTDLSDVQLDGRVTTAMLNDLNKGRMQVKTNSSIALQDISTVFPEYKPMLSKIPQYRPITVRGSADGNLSRLNIHDLYAEIPRYARADVKGYINNPTDMKRLSGELDIDGRFDNINFVKPTLLDKATQAQVNFPLMSVKGHAKFDANSVAGNVDLRTAQGRLAAKGSFNAGSEGYDVDATMDNFPVKSILPLMEVDNITAHVKAKGKGFDFLKPNTTINADVDLAQMVFKNAQYKNVVAHVQLNGGQFAGNISSNNKNLDLDMQASGSISGEHYIINADGVVNDVDLQALNLYDGVCRGKGRVNLRADVNTRTKEYDCDFVLNDVQWTLDEYEIFTDEAKGSLYADSQKTTLKYNDEDTYLDFTAQGGIDDLMKSIDKTSKEAMTQFDTHSLNINTLQDALPKFDMTLQCGPNGIIPRFLGMQYDVDFREINAQIRNDSTLFMDGWVHSLNVGDKLVDTITFHAQEQNKYLAFNAHMGNRPGTMDEFAQVDIEGGAIGSTLDFLVKQRNIKGEMGYRLGANAQLTDTAVNVRFFPKKPIIGYREWSVNDSNYVNINYAKRRLEADLNLESDSSIVALRTAPSEKTGKDDILLKIANVKIQEWTHFMPDMVPMTGVLDADMKVAFDGKNLEGDGVVKLTDFTYDGRKEGNLTMNTNLSIDPSTASTMIKADVDIDGSRVALAYGSLNDSTKNDPLNVTMNLDRFPLKKLTAFIPGRYVSLQGYLNGEMEVSGTMDNPRLNGFVVGDSAKIRLPKYGSTLTLSDEKIAIDSNVVRLNNYKVYGMNERAANVNGIINIKDVSNPTFDIRLDGKNVQVIGEEQRRFSQIFGKGYADLSASIKGNANVMDIRANVSLLPTSNITYVMQEDLSSLASTADENMVKFYNPYDSLTIASMDSVITTGSQASAMSLTTDLKVEQGAKINAYLSTDGKDRVALEGNGQLKYSIDFAGKDNLSGQYVISGGSVRYTPPVISQKVFDLIEGSTITWTGDVLNPQLDLSGKEVVRTSVSNDDGNGSRLVDFTITAYIGNNLNNIDLSFDMSANNDMTIQNELQMMTDVQRSQAAINMLLYGTYSGMNTASNPNINASSTIMSFLQSQLNTWAQSNLKGIDISFGINQYEGSRNGKTGTQTSYSYRLSKTLFDDRFKIIIGGEYSTEATSEENFSQNLINDISFEYDLDPNGTKYLRLFRHTGYESILEGEVTRTGLGFVMKRKVSSLRHLFRYKSPERKLRDSLENVRKQQEKLQEELKQTPVKTQ